MFPTRVEVQASIVIAQIEKLKTLYPDLTDDIDLLAGTIEGETQFEAVLDKIVERFVDAAMVRDAIARRAEALEVRGARYERQADAMRSLAFGMMRAAEQQTVRLPEATVSISAGRKRLVIDDPSAIPQGYVRIERVPLKTDIAAALNAGDAIPGAHLEPAEPHLSIRTK